MPAFAPCLWAAALAALGASVDTGALVADVSDATLTSLVARGPDVPWLAAPTPLYEVAGGPLDAQLTAEPLPDGQLLLRLTLSHDEAEAVTADVVFPRLAGLGTGAGGLGYLFPALGPILDDEVTTHTRHHGALFPLQVVEIHEAGRGLWVMTRDTEPRRKTYGLTKGDDGRATVWVERPGLRVPAGATVTLEASVGVHGGTWHEALAAYRRWLRTWFQPAAPRKATFQEAYHLRQLHLHPNPVLGDHTGAFDPETGTYRLDELLAQDVEAFGGVDWLHLFDWGMDWVHGRVGDYVPWSYLGDPAALVAEVDALQAGGRGVGLYVEGYLVDPPSLTGQAWGEAWAMADAGGAPYATWAPSWHICPGVEAWRAHMAILNGRRTERRVGASGLYVDQLGFGYQYPCHRADHDHAAPSDQVAEEAALLRATREAMSPDQVLYIEAAPADVLRQLVDGSFTEAVAAFRSDPRTVPLNLGRFVVPDFKTFELLVQDAPLGSDVEGVRLAFFNGQGVRLLGDPDADGWFAPETLEALRQAREAFRSHRGAFGSDAPEPLVATPLPHVLANRFPGDDEDVWTVLNDDEVTVSGPVLDVAALPGETWSDCWGAPLPGPGAVDALGPGEVTCLVRTRPADPAELLAAWTFDGENEPAGAHPRFGQALVLDGVDQQIALGSPIELSNLTAGFSLAAWVRPDSVGGVQRVLAVEGWDDGGLVFGLTESQGRGALVLTTVGVHDYVVPAVVAAERWSHLAVVLDGGATATFYLDGEPIAVQPGPGPAVPAAGPWWIGSNGQDGYFGGGLDEVRVYDGVLSPAQVRALADIAPPLAGQLRAADGVVTETDALTLWWPGFHDPGAGLAAYLLALGTTPGPSDLWGPADMGLAVSATLDGLSLPDGVVYATVTAVDAVGLQTGVTSEVVVDTSPAELLGQWDAHAEVPAELFRDREVSVTAWIAPDGPGWTTVLGADEGGWSFGLGGDGDDLHFVTRGMQDFVGSTTVPSGAWSHVAVVFDRWHDVTFYLDGAAIGTTHGAIRANPPQGPLWVGGAATPWVGGLADVRLYDGTLRPAEVAALSAAGAPGEVGPEPGPQPEPGPEPEPEPESGPEPDPELVDPPVPDEGSSGDGGGGSCTGGPTGAGWAALLLAAAALRRRRGPEPGPP